MRALLTVPVLMLLLPVNLHAATVVPSTNVSMEPAVVPFGEFRLRVRKEPDPVGWYTEAIFDSGESGAEATIQAVSTLLDPEGSDWYVVNAGEEFSQQSIESGAHIPLMTLTLEFDPGYGHEVWTGADYHPPHNFGLFDDLYLGVVTGLGSSEGGVRSAFGWVLLRVELSQGGLTMIDNVMSYNSPGIIVGTTTVIPEPSTMLMAGVGLVGLAFRRRRNG